jgi:hypothetical protein
VCHVRRNGKAIAIKLQHLMDEKKTESVAQQTAAAQWLKGSK